MSTIAIAMNLLLAGLLVVALMFGWMLNRRLKALKDSHAGFADSVAILDRAAQRAELGLAELRSATEQASDLLASRIAKARDLSDDLERLTARGAAVLERRDAARPAAPLSPRALADQIAAERAQLRGAHTRPAPQPVAHPAARPVVLPLERTPFRAERTAFDQEADRARAAQFPLTSEEEALAAAETLILRLSQAEALTSDEPPRYAAHTAPRAATPSRRPAPAPEPEFYEPQPQVQARPNPRSRALVDDDLFDTPLGGGRLRAFDGGRA